jgi:hypothetical protein
MKDANNDNGNETSKTIFVVRHGVARHNVADAQTGQMPNLHNPSLLDPLLIRYGEEGVQRARDLLLHHHAREQQQPPNQTHYVPLVDLVVTSPLTRCLQTAHILFHDRSAGPIPPFLCHDGVREAFGCHYPDKRQPKSKLQVHISPTNVSCLKFQSSKKSILTSNFHVYGSYCNVPLFFLVCLKTFK